MGDATKLDLEAWDRDMRINVTSMVLMARHCIPEMVSRIAPGQYRVDADLPSGRMAGERL